MTEISFNKITVIGMGYVGFTLASLISKYFIVQGIDIDNKKVKKINNGISPISDQMFNDHFDSKNLFNCYSDFKECAESDLFIICTPTNFNEETGNFDTASVDSVLKQIEALNINDACVLIKSTVPVGFTSEIIKKYTKMRIVFSPEFLREGNAIEDTLYPSRIIVSGDEELQSKIADLMIYISKDKAVPVLKVDPCEAESIKLFSNTFLALRVAFFNEVDNFALKKGFSATNIIKGISHDSRIGNFYNNPSFGYGGYCLPKDTKQLLNNFESIPQDLIAAVISANKTRKKLIVNEIKSTKTKTIGIYRLVMKINSDNFRESAVIDIINSLKESSKKIIIFEPQLNTSKFLDCPVLDDFDYFCSQSDIIVANRLSERIKNQSTEIFSRDLFNDS